MTERAAMWRDFRKGWFSLTADERRALLFTLAVLLVGLAARALRLPAPEETGAEHARNPEPGAHGNP